MKITDAITALKACLERFGDVECAFTTTPEGANAVELKKVDPEAESARRFNARFPTKDIWIPSRN